MKEKALKRYAHFISILLNIVCIVFGVLSVSLFAGIVVIVCARLFLPEMFRQAWETAVKAGQTLSFGQCAFFFICCLGMLICIFLALKDCLDVSAKEILLLQLKQPVRYGK